MSTSNDKLPPNPRLGDLIEEFRPMMGNIVAGMIISAAMVLGGAAAILLPLRQAYLAHWHLPLNVETGWSWLAVGGFALIGVLLVVFGALLAIYSKGLMSRRVELRENGFRYCSRKSGEDVTWAEVNLVQETNLHERPPILKGPAKLLVPKIVSTSYTLNTASGRKYCFNGNSIKAIKRFGELLRAEAGRRSLNWETIEEHG
jgi:hypothetical protein